VTTLTPGEGPAVKAGDLVKIELRVTTPGASFTGGAAGPAAGSVAIYRT
jgi:hypothetical protein